MSYANKTGEQKLQSFFSFLFLLIVFVMCVHETRIRKSSIKFLIDSRTQNDREKWT